MHLKEILILTGILTISISLIIIYKKDFLIEVLNGINYYSNVTQIIILLTFSVGLLFIFFFRKHLIITMTFVSFIAIINLNQYYLKGFSNDFQNQISLIRKEVKGLNSAHVFSDNRVKTASNRLLDYKKIKNLEIDSFSKLDSIEIVDQSLDMYALIRNNYLSLMEYYHEKGLGRRYPKEYIEIQSAQKAIHDIQSNWTLIYQEKDYWDHVVWEFYSVK